MFPSFRPTLLRSAATLLAAAPLLFGSAHAAFPDHQVTIVVPFAPGGGSDIVARTLSNLLTQDLKQTFIVDNKPGAGANIGAKYTAAARPDGYTIMVISSVLTANPTLYAKQHPFDAIKDFTPIVEIGDSPNVIVTRPQSGIKNVADLIARAKADPNLLNYSNPGAGTAPHIAVEYFKYRAGINITNVPYSGAGPSMQAALSGDTQLGSFSLGSVAQYMSSGRLVGLVHTGRGRLPDFPNVPNMTEAGFPNSELATFQVLVGPAGMPKEVVDILAKATLAILKRPDVQETLKNTGFGIIGGGPEQLKARIAQEVPMYREMITKANIKID
ncbi:MAG: transporter substrate-binding protein [Betaproteobacteria bacterium]|nr:transporter substrate-binding protein [Betaproteobacteria bacterium]